MLISFVGGLAQQVSSEDEPRADLVGFELPRQLIA
jgi:hypothetical protein